MRRIALVALAVFVAAIVLANWLVTRYGLVWAPFGTKAAAGTYMVGVTFPARDVCQRYGGRVLGVIAIILGAAVSWLVASPVIALASGGTFLISESLDAAIWTPLQRRFVLAVIVSSVIAAIVDTVIFITWAGLPSSAIPGTIYAKLATILLVGAPAAWVLRRKAPVYTDELVAA